MAKRVVQERGVSIKLACQAFKVSEACYRYVSKRKPENEEIANWLLRLTDNHRSWGFGLCFLYLRNVRGFSWNHKRVYRIYREQELNLRIKPRKRADTRSTQAACCAQWTQPDLVAGLYARPACRWAKHSLVQCN